MTIDEIFPDGRWATEDEYLMQCPFCGDGGHNHMYVNPKKGLFHCYFCGESGHLSFLLKKFGDGKLISTFDVRRTEEKIVPKTDFESFLCMTDFQRFDPETALPINYLERRGISLREAQLYQIRFAISGRYKHRVIIPIFEREAREVVCFSARTYMDEKPKYLFPHAGETLITTSEALYGSHWASGYRKIVLVEGAFDALAINRKLGTDFCGISFLSKHMCTGQLFKLLKFPIETEFFVMMDADAHKETSKIAAEIYKLGRNVKSAFLVSGDPDTASPEEIISAIERAEKPL
jgi:hypothetical protein